MIIAKTKSYILLISMSKLNVFLAVFTLIFISGWLILFHQSGSAPAPSSSAGSQQKRFNTKQFSLSDPSSIWVVVNKKHPLNPKDYIPNDLRVPNVALRSSSTSEEMKLRNQAATALEKMFTAAKEQGTNLILASGYRSYSLQNGVYNRYVDTQGQEVADSQSARPGYSEHQTGLAVDVGGTNRVCEIEGCFADTPEGKWVAANAYKFGFIVRYKNGTEDTVGYIYEPWHLRFVGIELATELNRLGNPTLEEFFQFGPAATY